MDIAGVENIVYRFAPCGGVKLGCKHNEGCNNVASTNSIKPCRQHLLKGCQVN